MRYGGLEGVPNLSLVESAIARPYSGYYPKLYQKAAALVQSMTGNHGFADGNKRTALILTHSLITNSDYQLEPLLGEDIEQAIEDLILAAASGSIASHPLHESVSDGFMPRIAQRRVRDSPGWRSVRDGVHRLSINIIFAIRSPSGPRSKDRGIRSRFRWRLATSPASKISQRLREKPKPPLMCYLRGRYNSARVKRISDRLRRSA